MAKKKKVASATKKDASTAVEQTEERLGAAGTAKKVSENVLGGMLGVGGKKKEPLERPDDKIVLAVEEDRTRLVVQGAGLLLAVLFALVATLVFWGAANLTGNVVFLLLVIVFLTVAWFVSRAMGKRFNRLFSHTNVIDFGERHIFVYERADPKKALVIPYKDIKNYRLIRQGRAMRLLLSGAWVTHPSGYQLVDINRPFEADTLDELSHQVAQIMREHRVSARV